MRLGDVSVCSKGSGITKNELVENGVPCVRYGELYTRHNFRILNFYSFIDDKNLDKRKLIRNNDLLFAGSGETRKEIGKCASFNHNIKAYAGGDVIVFSINPKKLRADFASYYLNTIGRRQMNKFGQGDSIVHIYGRFLKDIRIPVPPLSKQQNIISLLTTWDVAIEKTEALIAAKQRQFKWLTTRLICQTKHRRDLISNCAREVSVRNKNQKVKQVMSVTNHSGFVLPENQFSKQVASDNTHNYKIVRKGQYAYNPARINVGSIARLSRLNECIISPMYIVFELAEHIDSDFFLHWLSSHEAKESIKNTAQGSVRKTVGFRNLASIPIPAPSLPEQSNISRILNTRKNEIDLLKNLAEQYRIQKHGLMQKLLTGEWGMESSQILSTV